MSFLETLVILLVAVIVFGPKRLPEVMRKVGRILGTFQRIKEDYTRQLMQMDQMANDTLNSAVGNLDNLVPTTEELQQATDFSIPEPPLPTASPDDMWGIEPVPGGLPTEVAPSGIYNSPEAPAPQNETPASEASASQEAEQSSAAGAADAAQGGASRQEVGASPHRAPAEPKSAPEPRILRRKPEPTHHSLGLSPTKPSTEVHHG